MKNRELLENELRDQKPVAVAKVQIGQVVAIYDDCYKRANVKSTNSPYTCWLLDYGIHRDVRNVYKISTESANKVPLVKQGDLIILRLVNRFWT